MLATYAPILLIAAAVGGVAYALLFPLLSGERRSEARRKAVYEDTEIPRAARQGGIPRSKRDQVAQSLKEVEQREKARGKLTLKEKIAQAGLALTPKQFYVFSLVSAVAGGFLGFLLIKNPIGILPGLLVGGLGVPNWYLVSRRNKRIKKFLIEFPNALDVITRGLKSGLPLNDCVRIIASEAAEPIKSEFRMMMEAQSVGIALGDAIEDMYRRIPVPEANYFAIIITIQQKSGGNLAESLSNMSKVVRERRKLKNKVKALSAEATTSAGIIAAMPVGVMAMVYLSTPNYIEKLWTTQAGVFTLIGSGFWMLMGILIMRKMINFNV